MSEVNEGVGIILARMETNPEEFFESHRENNKWRWMFSESLREVMSEPEKAAIFEGMKKVRRLEITHKAIATVMPKEEEEEKGWPDGSFGKALINTTKNSTYWDGIAPREERKRIK
jgi:hypothetical protein